MYSLPEENCHNLVFLISFSSFKKAIIFMILIGSYLAVIARYASLHFVNISLRCILT